MALYNYITSTGVVVPDTADILEEVSGEYRDIFGDDFIVDPESPEGALIAAEVSSRVSVARNNASLANQINPNLAGGHFFDAIWALTGGQRNAPIKTIVQAVVTGIPGVSIPRGAMAETRDGNRFEAVNLIVLNASGLAVADFRSIETGPVPAPANSLTTIVNQILGWETINNPAAGTLGSDTEKDAEAKAKRRTQLALQGRNVAQAVKANVSAVPGVRSLAFRENVRAESRVIDGITLAPHSIWVAVQGGTNEDVARALLEAKSAGANWNGSVSVNVVEPASGQRFPVRLERPSNVRLLVRVTIRSGSSTSVDPIAIIRNAVIDYANGNIEGEEGFIVGQDASPFELSSAIGRNNPGIFVTRVEISAQTPVSYSTDTFSIALDQVATVVASDVTVVQE